MKNGWNHPDHRLSEAIIHSSFLEGQLEEVTEKHLGLGHDHKLGESQHSNRLVAQKFVQFFHAGRRKFTLTERRTDLEALSRISQQLHEVVAQKRILSRETCAELESEIPEVERQSIEYLLGPRTGDSTPTEMTPWSLISLADKADSLAKQIEKLGRDRKVNWNACAAAHLAKVVWHVRTGKEAPRTVHPDTLGPFGTFLQDALDVLFQFPAFRAEPVNARSALRALENITTSGSRPRGNW